MPGRSFSFRSLLTAIMLSLVVLSVGGILSISIYFTGRAVNNLAGQIIAQRLQTIDDRIDTLMQAAIDQNDLNSRLTTGKTGNSLESADFRDLFPFVTRSFETQRQLSYLGLTLEKTGEYCMIERHADGQVDLRAYIVEQNGTRTIREYTIHDTAIQLVQTHPWDDKDPRSRPYYLAAKNAGHSVWTETYAFGKSGERGALPGITYATPIYNARHELLGVWDIDFDTRTLCQFLKVLDDDFSGYSVVLEHRHDGSLHLIAHPSVQVLLDAQVGQLSQSDQLDDHIVRELMRHLVKDGRNSGELDLSVEGTDYLTAWKAIENPAMPRWTVVTILPRDDIMRDTLANRRWGFLLLGSIVTLVTWLAIRVSSRIAQRLGQLEAEARKIGQLQLDHTPEQLTGVREFDHLSQAIDEMKTNLRSFRKYVPAELVRDLVQSGREAGLGGRTGIVSIYFSDIVDFTSTAETLDPTTLVDHLGAYLDAMSEGIARHGGTVDKFIGDSVMAFWNAPQPNPDHALDACRAALDNQRRLVELQEKWRATGQPLFHTRIGLHTGEVVVGNIGSEIRMNYTIIGDSVNLGSRLQNLNKLYGTRILLSGKMHAMVRDAVVARPVERVSPKGRRGGDEIYELIGLCGEVSDTWLHRCEQTVLAWQTYLARDFTGAAAIYRELVENGDSTVAVVLLRRCEEYRATPPPANWDGTWNIEA